MSGLIGDQLQDQEPEVAMSEKAAELVSTAVLVSVTVFVMAATPPSPMVMPAAPMVWSLSHDFTANFVMSNTAL
jgi:hypothetical protein